MVAMRAEDELRDLQRRLLARARDGNGFPNYLSSVLIIGLRGITYLNVGFVYPVTALVGLNGSAKSTVLNCAACAYKPLTGAGPEKPYFLGHLFNASPFDTLEDIEVRYTVCVDGQPRSYSVTKKSKRWRGYNGRSERAVSYLPLSRITPKLELRRFAVLYRTISLQDTSISDLDSGVVACAQRILGINYDGLAQAQAKKQAGHEISVARRGALRYSELHMGAGEAAVIGLVSTILKAPVGSLIVIEEIENTLHPAAQERVMHFLQKQAFDRNLQVVVTTHSVHVLEALPAEARWLLRRPERGTVHAINGVSPKYALSQLVERKQPELTLFVEDELAEQWLREILVRHEQRTADRVQIVEAAGAERVLEQVKTLREIPGLGPCALVLDGDCPIDEEPKKDKYGNPIDDNLRLPGGRPPERVLFTDRPPELAAALSEKLDRTQDRVEGALVKALRYSDHHDWVPTLSAELGLEKVVVHKALISIWLGRDIANEGKHLAERIAQYLAGLPGARAEGGMR